MFIFGIEDVDCELKSRRFAYIQACAYYIRLKGINGDLDQLVMTSELVELITERYKYAKLDWAIGDFKSYEQMLIDGMQETRNFFLHSVFGFVI